MSIERSRWEGSNVYLNSWIDFKWSYHNECPQTTQILFQKNIYDIMWLITPSMSLNFHMNKSTTHLYRSNQIPPYFIITISLKILISQLNKTNNNCLSNKYLKPQLISINLKKFIIKIDEQKINNIFPEKKKQRINKNVKHQKI